MKIHLVSPTHYNADGSLHKTPRYWTSGLTLPYLKRLTPPEHTVTMVDELFYDVDLDADADVVGITATGPQIARADELADQYRARGKKVVLGGTSVTLAPEESLAHADAVVAGEAEFIWANVLADLAAGRSRGVYRASEWQSLVDLPRVDYKELPLLKWPAFQSSWLYRMYFHWPIVFSRGCQHPCGGDRLLFLDDNPVALPEAAKEMFRALVPYGMKWASQSTINIARDPELLDLAARSGCVALSIGLESGNEESPTASTRASTR